MARNGRFGLSLKIMTVLAEEPGAMRTSDAIARELAESAVMVRRCFLLLHKRGLIDQRKGPNGGARLKLPARQIGLGEIFLASEVPWLTHENPAIAGLLRRTREAAVLAMNQTTLAQVAKRIRRAADARRDQRSQADESAAF